MGNFKNLYSKNAENMQASVIRELLKLTNQPGIISFAGGLPAPQTFPAEELKQASDRLFAGRATAALQYGTTEGDDILREQLVAFEAQQGLKLARENLIVVSASQQALDMVCKLFLDPGDAVIAGSPSYLGAIQAIQSYRGKVLGIPFAAERDGFDMDSLRSRYAKARAEGLRIKFIYVITDFQNPTGIAWSLEKRRQLLDFAYETGLPIVEDAPYREIRFLGDSLPSLYQLDQEAEARGNVLNFKTFSKILAPGLRLGWIIGDPELLSKLVIAKQAMDLSSNVFAQALAAEYLQTGRIHDQIAATRELYRSKRNHMITALETHMPRRADLSWTKPEGGLFLWLSLPASVDTDKMFYRALERKVAYVVGSAFYFDEVEHNAMRLNFSYPSTEQIDEGIRRLAECISEELGSARV